VLSREKNRAGKPVSHTTNPTLRKRLVLLPDAAVPCTFSEAYAKGCALALRM
jgi:hypothetical protein